MSVWAAIAGGLNEVQRKNLQAYEQRLKEQEERNKEAREERMARLRAEIAEESAVRMRAGTVQGNPTPTPGGGIMAFQWDESGRNLSRQEIGRLGEDEIEAQRREQEAAARRQELDELKLLTGIGKDEAAASRYRAGAFRESQTGLLRQAERENPETHGRGRNNSNERRPSPQQIAQARKLAEDEVRDPGARKGTPLTEEQRQRARVIERQILERSGFNTSGNGGTVSTPEGLEDLFKKALGG